MSEPSAVMPPTLVQVLSQAVPRLERQLRTDFLWICLQLPEDPPLLLDYRGRRPQAYPHVCLQRNRDGWRLEDPARGRLVGVVSLRFLRARLQVVLGRARPLGAPEQRRLRIWRSQAQEALHDAAMHQLQQTIETQAARQDSLTTSWARHTHDALNALIPAMHALEFLAEARDPVERFHFYEVGERNMQKIHGLLREALHPSSTPTAGCDWGRIIAERSADWALPFQQGHGFSVQVPMGPVTVRGTANQLESIVANLLSNAYKFTPAGGQVNLRLALAGPWAVLEVSDTGLGLAPAVREHLFQAGIRGHVWIEGSGRGLADVADLVQLLAGQVEVESTEGCGTTFRVRLPVEAHEA